MPPAFALSQDQTLRFSPGQPAPGDTPPAAAGPSGTEPPAPSAAPAPRRPQTQAGQGTRAQNVSQRVSRLYTNQRHASDAPRPSQAAKQAQKAPAAPGRARQAGQPRTNPRANPPQGRHQRIPSSPDETVNERDGSRREDPAPNHPFRRPSPAKPENLARPRRECKSFRRRGARLSRPRSGARQPPIRAS